MPHIPNPSNEEIDEYHAKYVEALQQLYDDNKSLLPDQPDMKIVQRSEALNSFKSRVQGSFALLNIYVTQLSKKVFISI